MEILLFKDELPFKTPNFVFSNSLASLYVFGTSSCVSDRHIHLLPYVNMQLQERDAFLSRMDTCTEMSIYIPTRTLQEIRQLSRKKRKRDVSQQNFFDIYDKGHTIKIPIVYNVRNILETYLLSIIVFLFLDKKKLYSLSDDVTSEKPGSKCCNFIERTKGTS